MKRINKLCFSHSQRSYPLLDYAAAFTICKRKSFANPVWKYRPENETQTDSSIKFGNLKIFITGKRYFSLCILLIFTCLRCKSKPMALATLRLNSNCLLRMWFSCLFQSHHEVPQALIPPRLFTNSSAQILIFREKEHDLHIHTKLYRTCSWYLHITTRS